MVGRFGDPRKVQNTAMAGRAVTHTGVTGIGHVGRSRIGLWACLEAGEGCHRANRINRGDTHPGVVGFVAIVAATGHATVDLLGGWCRAAETAARRGHHRVHKTRRGRVAAFTGSAGRNV